MAGSLCGETVDGEATNLCDRVEYNHGVHAGVCSGRREWRGGEIPAASVDRPGVLKVSVTEDGATIVSFNPEAAGARSFDVYLATLGFSLNSDVKAGENRGRKLQHDFVVLSLLKETMTAPAAEVRVSIEALRQKQSKVGAVAVWITEPGRTEPVQAVAGWLR